MMMVNARRCTEYRRIPVCIWRLSCQWLGLSRPATEAAANTAALPSASEPYVNAVRETGECIFDEESGLLIARRRVGNATFWVKFSREEDGHYLVHRAWSHRMNVVKREG